jgi:hypothetical protein
MEQNLTEVFLLQHLVDLDDPRPWLGHGAGRRASGPPPQPAHPRRSMARVASPRPGRAIIIFGRRTRLRWRTLAPSAFSVRSIGLSIERAAL